MSTTSTSSSHTLIFVISLSALLLPIACGKKTQPKAATEQAKQQTAVPSALAPDEPPAPSTGVALPTAFGRRTGDLDEMVKNRNIRALLILNPIGFFYDKGQPRGVMYEALEEFQKFANQKLKTGKLDVKVTFLPVRLDQIEAALTQGMGDMIASGIMVTPDREKRVAFSAPLQSDITQIIVTGPDFGPVSTLADLGGKEVYVNPLSNYYENLQKANETLQKAGKTPILIKAADKNLTNDDLVQMVNAGLIPATVTTKERAALWSQVLDHIQPHPDLVIASGGQLAWVMRKNNPQLKQLVDEFLQTHATGTSFGNTLLRRYLQNTKWVRNSTSGTEMKKFQTNLALFQKYAGEYSFDYLMIAAQGYQESLLDQSKRNPSGAVGIMQVIPKFAAASPISIPNVGNADGNIHAGVKMLRNIEDTYFNDPQVDSLNKTLFVFASYNAGPNRIARLRKEAVTMGLDPNIWFGNVELVAAQDIGQETVTYVSNIYKYYVAYKLALAQSQLRQKATGLAPK
ncbi:lytic transglycosylase F [Acidobacterium sp. S8]|uniref:transporter substrate-binding domain-containing protein n=1 Tax=Acidobacterium sp. S8 TaxID=1641854 RepID=UPI00131D93E9|nr:lytic transglycosylase F [Acidobacterium sp. S8]